MNIFWYMCAPDGAYPWQPEGSRKVDLGYYKQLALAYDQLGYTGALLPPARMTSGCWRVRCSPIPSG